MPLFTYKCIECECTMEKFQHSGAGSIEVECTECGGLKCEKIMPFANNRVLLDAKDMLRDKIGPDAKRIMDNMKKGNSKDFFDIYGDN